MRLGLAVLLAMGLTGCSAMAQLPTAHQIEHMALLEAVAVDAVDDAVGVTAVSGGRPAAGSASGEEPVTLTAQGATLTSAWRETQIEGSDFVYLGHVADILVGEAQAEVGLTTLFDYLMETQELRLQSNLWLVRGGTGGTALTQVDGVTDRLKAILEDGKAFGLPQAVTGQGVVSQLMEQGSCPVPALSVDEAGNLNQAGYGLLRGDGLVAWIGGEAALGVTYCTTGGRGGVVELALEDATVAVEILDCSVKVKPVVADGKVTGLTVSPILKVVGDVDEADIDQLEAQLAEEVAHAVRSAVAVGQSWNCDYLGLLKKAAVTAPWYGTALDKATIRGLTVTVVATAEMEGVGR